MAKFRKVSADEAQAKRKEHLKDGASGLVMVKGFKAPPSWNKETRSARFTMTSESVDRYKDIVVQAGLDITRFQENPQALIFHNSRSWPCGKWNDVQKILNGRPRRTEGTLEFLPEGVDEDADRAARHVAAGSIRCVSIGFIPNWDAIEFILDDDEDWTGGFRYLESEMIECSVVPVPAQPDALVKDAGGDMKLARDLIEDILDTYAKTPEGLLIPLDAYEKAYRTTVEKIKEDEIAPITGFKSSGEVAGGVDWEIPSKYAGAFTADQDADLLRIAGEQGAEAADAALATLVEQRDAGVEGDGGEKVFLADTGDYGPFKGFTDETIDAFSALVKDGDIVTLRDADDLKLVIERTGEQVQELLLPSTMTVAAIKDLQAKIAERSVIAPAAEDEPEGSAVIELQVDTTEATEKVTAFEKLVDSVAAKMAKLFGTKSVEPEIKAPPPAPSPEAIEAAKVKAAAVRDRVAAKGLFA